jgi:protoheme ferro-lyase
MSLATEKKLISKNYYPLVNTTSEMTYVKKFDECTQYTIKKRNSKYIVTFPIAGSSSSYTTQFADYELASKYLYDIVDEIVV